MMKAITRFAYYSLSAAALTASAFATTPQGWMADLDKAFAKAKMEKKAVLVEFTGSDWCPPCIVLKKDVFSQKEFVTAASKKFILVEVDFPRAQPDVAKKNEPLMEKYKVDGFPTVLLFTSDGKEFTRFDATQFPSVSEFLKHLNEALEKKDLD
ncbi:MAG: thioredoxin family protein [Gloeobacteraceae cyanobacterium ES-bin-144]|nr:thioredoxin family protein [Verrucomicrobiales bacterium]